MNSNGCGGVHATHVEHLRRVRAVRRGDSVPHVQSACVRMVREKEPLENLAPSPFAARGFFRFLLTRRAEGSSMNHRGESLNAHEDAHEKAHCRRSRKNESGREARGQAHSRQEEVIRSKYRKRYKARRLAWRVSAGFYVRHRGSGDSRRSPNYSTPASGLRPSKIRARRTYIFMTAGVA